jgi:hypothetical protein
VLHNQKIIPYFALNFKATKNFKYNESTKLISAKIYGKICHSGLRFGFCYFCDISITTKAFYYEALIRYLNTSN